MIVVGFDTKLIWFAIGLCATALAQPADLVLHNGKIATESSATEAQAMAARGGRIVALGSNKTVDALIGPATRVIDLEGRLAIPGFIEGHGHFTELGATKTMLDLRSAKNWDEIVALVGAAAQRAKPGTWILGRGFHQAKWDRVPELEPRVAAQSGVAHPRQRTRRIRQCAGHAAGRDRS
jgi:predicted amidohydrolase YtcJ